MVAIFISGATEKTKEAEFACLTVKFCASLARPNRYRTRIVEMESINKVSFGVTAENVTCSGEQ